MNMWIILLVVYIANILVCMINNNISGMGGWVCSVMLVIYIIKSIE